jgi:hypothetical protein
LLISAIAIRPGFLQNTLLETDSFYNENKAACANKQCSSAYLLCKHVFIVSF